MRLGSRTALPASSPSGGLGGPEVLGDPQDRPVGRPCGLLHAAERVEVVARQRDAAVVEAALERRLDRGAAWRGVDGAEGPPLYDGLDDLAAKLAT